MPKNYAGHCDPTLVILGDNLASYEWPLQGGSVTPPPVSFWVLQCWVVERLVASPGSNAPVASDSVGSSRSGRSYDFAPAPY